MENQEDNPFLIKGKAKAESAKPKTVYTAADFDDISPVGKKKAPSAIGSANGGNTTSYPASKPLGGLSPEVPAPKVEQQFFESPKLTLGNTTNTNTPNLLNNGGFMQDVGGKLSGERRSAISDTLSVALQAYDAKQGQGASAANIASSDAKYSDPLSGTDSSVNSLKNLATRLKGSIPRLNVVAADVWENVLGKELAGKFYELEGRDIDEERMSSYAELEKLTAEMKPTLTLTGAIENGSMKQFAAGFVNTVTSLASSVIPALATGGAGTFTEMTGDSIVDFNTEKAKRLGISLNELYATDQADLKIPGTIGALSGALELVGLKGVQNLMTKKITGTAFKKAALFFGETQKEGLTEWLQTGLETANNSLGKGEDGSVAAKNAIDKMFSKEGLESYLQGVVGAAGAGAIGQVKSLVTSPSSKSGIDLKIGNIDMLQAEIQNPNLSPQSQEVLKQQITNNISSIAQEVENDEKAIESLPEEKRKDVARIDDQINELYSVVEDPNVSENVKADMQSQISSLESNLNTLVASGNQTFDLSPVKAIASQSVEQSAATMVDLAERLADAETPEQVAAIRGEAVAAGEIGIKASQILNTANAVESGKSVIPTYQSGEAISFQDDQGNDVQGLIKEVKDGKAVVAINNEGIYEEKTIDLPETVQPDQVKPAEDKSPTPTEESTVPQQEGIPGKVATDISKPIVLENRKPSLRKVNPNSDTEKQLSRQPASFLDAVNQFFVAGNKLSTEDFIAHTGFGYYKESDGKKTKLTVSETDEFLKNGNLQSGEKVKASEELRKAKFQGKVANRSKGGIDADQIAQQYIPLEFSGEQGMDIVGDIAIIAANTNKGQMLRDLVASDPNGNKSMSNEGDFGLTADQVAELEAWEKEQEKLANTYPDEAIDRLSDNPLIAELIFTETQNITLTEQQVNEMAELADRYMNQNGEIDWNELEKDYIKEQKGFNPDFLDNDTTLKTIFEYGSETARQQLNERAKGKVSATENSSEQPKQDAGKPSERTREESFSKKVIASEKKVTDAKGKLASIQKEYDKIAKTIYKNLKENQIDMLAGPQVQSMFDDRSNQQEVFNKKQSELKAAQESYVKAQEEFASVKESEGQINLELPDPIIDNLFDIDGQKTFYHSSNAKRDGRLKPGEAPQFGKGVYLSTNKDIVEGEFGKNTTEVSLKLENPVFTNSNEYSAVEKLGYENYKKNNLTWDEESESFLDKSGKEVDVDQLEYGENVPVKYLNDAAIELGHDAIIDKGSTTYDNEVVVLDETKIVYEEDLTDLSKTDESADAKIIVQNFFNPLKIWSTLQAGIDKFENNTFAVVNTKITDAIADILKNWRTSKSSTKQWASSLASSIFGGIARNAADTNIKLGLIGGKNMAIHNMGKVMKSLYSLVDSNTESLERIHVVLDPEIYQKGFGGQSNAFKSNVPPNLTYNDLTEQEKALYDEVRKNLDEIHFKNHVLGFIDKDTFDKYKGTYVPRMYETFELPTELKEVLDTYQDQIGDKLNLNPFKRRKGYDALSEDSKNAILKDPVYLMAKRMMELDTNSAIMTYINHVNRNNKSLIHEGANPPANFVLLEGKGYGALQGKYVASFVAEDLKGYMFANSALNWFYDGIKKYDRTLARQGVKKGLTVYNPFVQLGNFTSNIVFAQLSGIDFVRWFGNMPSAVKSFKDQDADYEYLLSKGLVGTDLLKSDMMPNTENANSLLATAQAKKESGFFNKLMKPIKKMDKIAMNLYGGNDDVGKLTAFKIFVAQGYSKEEAVKKVYDGFQNYATVGKAWDVAAKTPVLGNPFMKFPADLMRITGNAVTRKPLSTALYLAGLYMIPQLLKQVGLSDDDEDEEEKAIREGRPFIPKMDLGFINIPLVYKTKVGEVNLARYVTPFYYFDNGDDGALASMADRFNPYKSVTSEGAGKGNERTLPFGQDPVLGTLYNIMMDTDFRGKSIQNPEATRFRATGITEGEKWENRATHALRTWVPNGALMHDTYLNAKYGEDFYGRTRTVAQSLVNFAVKIQDFKEGDYKKTAEKQMMSMFNDLKSQNETIKNTLATDARARGDKQKKFQEGRLTHADYQNSLDMLDNQKKKRIEEALQGQAKIQKKIIDFQEKHKRFLQ